MPLLQRSVQAGALTETLCGDAACSQIQHGGGLLLICTDAHMKMTGAALDLAIVSCLNNPRVGTC
jgi:hypothetical protein